MIYLTLLLAIGAATNRYYLSKDVTGLKVELDGRVTEVKSQVTEVKVALGSQITEFKQETQVDFDRVHKNFDRVHKDMDFIKQILANCATRLPQPSPQLPFQRPPTLSPLPGSHKMAS